MNDYCFDNCAFIPMHFLHPCETEGVLKDMWILHRQSANHQGYKFLSNKTANFFWNALHVSFTAVSVARRSLKNHPGMMHKGSAVDLTNCK